MLPPSPALRGAGAAEHCIVCWLLSSLRPGSPHPPRWQLLSIPPVPREEGTTGRKRDAFPLPLNHGLCCFSGTWFLKPSLSCIRIVIFSAFTLCRASLPEARDSPLVLQWQCTLLCAGNLNTARSPPPERHPCHWRGCREPGGLQTQAAAVSLRDHTVVVMLIGEGKHICN